MIMIEDFVGFEAMTGNPLEKLGVYVRNRRSATRPVLLSSPVHHFFVGELDDIFDKRFGFGVLNRRDIARKYYQFLG